MSNSYSVFKGGLTKVLSKCRERYQAQTSKPDSDPKRNALWVDRYRPKRYLDLLGDDRVHREVMSWVKEWDYCVFGKTKGKKRARDEENMDEFRRPREKVGSAVDQCLDAAVNYYFYVGSSNFRSSWPWKDYSGSYSREAGRIRRF